MTRALFRDVVTDENGVPISNVIVDVFQQGTSTPLAETLYSGYTGGATLTNPFQSNTQGEVAFFLDAATDVDIRYTVDGFAQETFTAAVISAATAGVSSHGALSGVTANQHHNQAHTMTDHTGGTGSVAELTATAAAAGSGTTPARIDHTHQKNIDIRKNSTGSVFTRPRINLIEGSNVTLTVADDSVDGEVDVTIAASLSGSGISGSLTSPRIPYATGAASVADSANLAWDDVNNELELGSATKLLFSTDTNLFRNAADTLRTNDALIVDGLLTTSGGISPAGTGSAAELSDSAASAGTGTRPALVDHTHKKAVNVRKNSAGSVFTRPRLNLIEGSNVTLTVADDAGSDEVDVTIAASGGGSIDGTLVAGRIPYASDADTLTDSANLAWDNTNNELELGSAVKLLWSTDVNLYRAAADVLASDDAFSSIRGASSSDAFLAKVSGDTNQRFSVSAAGVMTWGSGAGAGDTNLYRNAANQLATDDQLLVTRASGASSGVGCRVTGNTNPRWQASADGRLFWSDGSNPVDITVARERAGVLGVYDALSFHEALSTPGTPDVDEEAQMYCRANKIIFQWNDGGTVRYKYLDLTGTGVTWVHTTTAP